MEIYDNYELWNDYTFRQTDGLTEDEIVYWSLFHRWPLVMAIYLSMGQIPYKKAKSGKMLESSARTVAQDTSNLLTDFENRLILAKYAAENGELVVERVPDSRGIGHPYVERLVSVRTFINWAKINFTTTYDPLFDRALNIFKSPEQAAYARRKGASADAVKVKITNKAITELEDGCRCHNTELARYLMKLKNRDNTPMYTLPGIMEERYEDHFNDAVIVAFKAKEVPLRNEPKIGEPRGKRYCKRPGHSA